MNEIAEKPDILSLLPEELEAALAALGQPRFRAAQIFQWLGRGGRDFDAMTNLSKDLREKLKENFHLYAPKVLSRQVSAIDGTINVLLRTVGIDSKIAWLGRTDTAIWTLIILAVWQFGSSMLIFLSSLKQIPASLYEAGAIDGANSVQRFFKITLPLLTPTIFFNLVMQMINGFLAFTQCYIITQGKPMNSTLFYTVYMYQQSFEFYKAGYGAALAWVMLVIIALFTGLLFATKRFWVYEDRR